MAVIILADDGISFDGQTPEKGPLGGAESSVIQLVEILAARGHDVTVYNKCAAPLDYKGVKWRKISDGVPDTADLYIANRGDKLLKLCERAKRTVFWTHNPCGYMLKMRYLWQFWRRKPVIVFIGDYHADTLPGWVPEGGRRTIPYGLPDLFCEAEPASNVPGPRAIFTSNPLRGLDWLLDRWANEIEPGVPGAELHIFSGAATYGAAGARKGDAMGVVLDKARALEGQGVRLREPVGKAALIDELRLARVMLYKGDINETFCLAIAEAQCLGVPCVVQPIGSMVERVRDRETGFIAPDDASFALAARRLLTDDALWRTQHDRALAVQRSWRWPDAAAAFEELI
ncbi:MAG: glycosyltransferase family 4 protein [Rhodospirillales bacterium]|nr:glycosyltransferase family 4 protein [Rhodospirillales bacterium]